MISDCSKAPESPIEGSRARGRVRASPKCGTRSQTSALSGPDPQHELIIFSDSQSLPEDYSSLHQNGWARHPLRPT